MFVIRVSLLSCFFFGLSSCQNLTASTDNKLEVTVYYETLCYDSMVFFTRQLYPSMKNMGRLDYTDLKLIPYGKAISYNDSETNELQIMCHHGTAECAGNALHACLIEHLNTTSALDIINCLMRGFRTDLDKCASHYNLNVENAKVCSTSRTVGDLLADYGQQTSTIALSFVPAIAIDKSFYYDEQQDLLERFDQTFCQKYKDKFNYLLEGCPEK